MYHTYELYSGSRFVGRRRTATPQAALFDYVRSFGGLDDEIVKVSPDVISWRGAVFKAVVQETTESDERRAVGGAVDQAIASSR